MKLKFVMLLMGLVVLIGCSSDLDENGGMGMISGSVSDMTTGEPVPTVNVTLLPGGKSTVTGTDGSFSFEGLEPGVYTVEIRKEGYSSNTGEVMVRAGETAQSHLLIGRQTASLTADKTELDFGESISTLSFSIVNRGYSNLEFKVEIGRCSWLSVDPDNGVLESGKTATIVAQVDRKLLDDGQNEAVIVVRSLNGSGSHEIKVTAYGVKWIPSVVSTQKIDNVTEESMNLYGRVVTTGMPAITEMGFVWNNVPDVTLENNIGKRVISQFTDKSGTYMAIITNLLPYTMYYARAYVIQDSQPIYGDVMTCTTLPKLPDIGTRSITNYVRSGTTIYATLNGYVLDGGVPAHTECGFCYIYTWSGMDGKPTLSNNVVRVNLTDVGDFSANINWRISSDNYGWLYLMARAYVIQNGKPIYGNVVRQYIWIE